MECFRSFTMRELRKEATPQRCKKFWAFLMFFLSVYAFYFAYGLSYVSWITQFFISFLKILLVLWIKLVNRRIISNLYSYLILFGSSWFILTIDWITSSQPTTCVLSSGPSPYLSADIYLKLANTSYRFFSTYSWLYSLKASFISKNLTSFFRRLFITMFCSSNDKNFYFFTSKRADYEVVKFLGRELCSCLF